MVSNAEYLRKALFGPFDADPCLADILRRSAEAGFDQHFFCPTTHNAEMTQIHITCWLDKVDLVCPDTLVPPTDFSVGVWTELLTLLAWTVPQQR